MDNSISEEYQKIIELVKDIMNPKLSLTEYVGKEITLSKGSDYIFSILSFYLLEPKLLLVLKNLATNVAGYIEIDKLYNEEHVKESAITLVLELINDKSQDEYLSIFNHIISELKSELIKKEYCN